MTINVKDSNHKAEKTIFDQVKSHIPEFKGIRFVHLEGEKTAIFDFEGYRSLEVVMRVDVKCKDISVDKYDSYIITKEKVWLANSDPDRLYFVIFHFNDDWCRVFDLHKCDLKFESLTFTHKRTKQLITQKVYKIPARNFAYEFYFQS